MFICVSHFASSHICSREQIYFGFEYLKTHVRCFTIERVLKWFIERNYSINGNHFISWSFTNSASFLPQKLKVYNSLDSTPSCLCPSLFLRGKYCQLPPSKTINGHQHESFFLELTQVLYEPFHKAGLKLKCSIC